MRRAAFKAGDTVSILHHDWAKGEVAMTAEVVCHLSATYLKVAANGRSYAAPVADCKLVRRARQSGAVTQAKAALRKIAKRRAA